MCIRDRGWQAKADISVKPAAAPVDPTVCQQLFSESLAKGKIRFESGRATIDPDSAGLLDRLIEIAMRCPTADIEIAGHTDADGEDASNQTLSEKRAQAVLDYLVKAGLPASRFLSLIHISPCGRGIGGFGRRSSKRTPMLGIGYGGRVADGRCV